MANAVAQGEIDWSWVDFSLGEDVRSESRLVQDESWKNAISDGRAHVSNREYCNLHTKEFIGAIESFEIVTDLLSAYYSKNQLSKLTVPILKLIVDLAFGQGQLVLAGEQVAAKHLEGKDNQVSLNSTFRLCARCRPIFNYEEDNGAYSCVDTGVRSSKIVIHDGRLARNGNRLTMSHKTFLLDRVWDVDANNDTVCTSEVEPLLNRAKDGHSSSLLCFGQTGTGKTYTLIAALAFVLKNLVGYSVEVTFYEIHGKKCYDLLSNRKLVHLRSDENEVVHVRGAKSIISLATPVGVKRSKDTTSQKDNDNDVNEDVHSNQQENMDGTGAKSTEGDSYEKTNTASPDKVYVDYPTLVKMMQEALTLRSSEVTERNPMSSRSHAICVIKLLGPPNKNNDNNLSNISTDMAPDKSNIRVGDPNASVDDTGYYGKITLVDLAGSERNNDTMKMTAVQHRESADINFALMALKDCFRAYYTQGSTKSTDVSNNSLKNSTSHYKLNNDMKNNVRNSQKYPNLVSNPNNLVASQRPDFIDPLNASAVRAPFRASLLTRVLRECFVQPGKEVREGGKTHFTTIITTLSPTPTDVQHSLNSIEHIVLMNPFLHSQVHEVTVEVPLEDGFLSHIPIDTWSSQQVTFWLANSNNGRFAQLSLPPGLDGEGLMQLNMVSLSALCEGQLRAARQGEEGDAWVVAGASEGDEGASAKHNYLGRALWAALRREQQHQKLTAGPL